MSTSASGSAARFVSVLRYPLRCCIDNLLVIIIYMLLMLRTHKHIYDVTNLLIIAIFWIKLLLKLPNILTSDPISSEKNRTCTSKLEKWERCCVCVFPCGSSIVLSCVVFEYA